MRYVDADAVIAKIRRSEWHMTADERGKFPIYTEDLLQFLEEFPTAETVKKGHWETRNDRYFHCSRCGGKDDSRRRFCGDCGAMMCEVKA